MAKEYSERRLIENELLLRSMNEQALQAVEESFSPNELHKKTFEFYCECSDLGCRQIISLEAKEYEKLHGRRDTFIIKKGHEEPGIERVVTKNHEYLLVEKYKLPAH